MRLLLCSVMLASAVFAVAGYPTEAEIPRKGGNPNSKPQQSTAAKPRPSLITEPNSSGGLQDGSQLLGGLVFQDIAQSSVTSELPGADVAEMASVIQASVQQPPHDPILETASNFELPETIVQDAIPEFDSESKREAGKNRRHAGEEAPEALRFGDFGEHDMGLLGFNLKAAPQYPISNPEQMGMEELSKEEMILMAMEQKQHNFAPSQGSHQSAKRPIMGSGANPTRSKPVPTFDEDFSDRGEEDEEEAAEDTENDSTIDLRNAENAAIIVQETEPSPPKPSQPAKGHVENQTPGSKNKPRPYGMDRPSKHRPTLGDKNEHFGLPHASNEYHKGENSESSDNSSVTYLGFQIPQIKWTSFSEYFPSFWIGGKGSKKMAKSDHATEEMCVEDEDQDEVRSVIASKGALCYGVQSTCNDACVNNGFASGTCLGPYPTPGCMCRMPKSKEFGVVLSPYESKSADKDLEPSDSPGCKKCECMQSCKLGGAYTGFCLDRCYCGNPWYTKKVSV